MPTNMLKGLKENKIEFLTQTNKLVFFNFLVKQTFFLLFDVPRDSHYKNCKYVCGKLSHFLASLPETFQN